MKMKKGGIGPLLFSTVYTGINFTNERLYYVRRNIHYDISRARGAISARRPKREPLYSHRMSRLCGFSVVWGWGGGKWYKYSLRLVWSVCVCVSSCRGTNSLPPISPLLPPKVLPFIGPFVIWLYRRHEGYFRRRWNTWHVSPPPLLK